MAKITGVFVVPYIFMKESFYYLLGKEGYGKHMDRYNLIGGQVEKQAIVEEANREFKEEVHYDAKITDKTPFVELGYKDQVTRVYYIPLTKDLDKVSAVVRKAFSNKKLDPCHRELKDVDLFALSDIEKNNTIITFLAINAVRKIERALKK